MKWINHQVVTGVVVYTATADLLLTAYSMAGAILPDKVEGNPRAGNYWTWRSRHRGWSHWPVLYLALLGVSRHFAQGDYGGVMGGELATIGSYIAIGALLHIAEDAVCGNVPIVTPNRKHGIKLFAVGSVFEYLFAIAIVLACYAGRVCAGVGG
jgi:inner membrane protein